MKLLPLILAVISASSSAIAGDESVVAIRPAHSVVRQVAAVQAIALARQLLLRIDDANRSGNFSVLRDLAADSFKQTLSVDDLAKLLNPLKQQNIELLPAAVLDPHFEDAFVARDGTEMRLSGYLDTSPKQITFAFSLTAVAGTWRLTDISVGLARGLKPRPGNLATATTTSILKPTID